MSKNKIITEPIARSLIVKSLYFPKQGNVLHYDIQKAISYEQVMFYSILENQFPQTYINAKNLQQQNDTKLSKELILQHDNKNETKNEREPALEFVEKIKQDTLFAQYDFRIYEEIKAMRKEIQQERAMNNLLNIMDQPGEENQQDNHDDNDELDMSMQISMGYGDDDLYHEQMRQFKRTNNLEDEEEDDAEKYYLNAGQFANFHEDNTDMLRNDDDDYDDYHESSRQLRNQNKRLEDEEIEELLEAQQRKAQQRSDEEEQNMIFNQQTLNSSVPI
eukprot:403333250